MIVPFLRSSLIGQWNLCQGRAFLEYGIGFRGEANKSALVGSIVHGYLELIALAKLNNQNSVDEFSHDTFGNWSTPYLLNRHDIDCVLEPIYDSYDKESPNKLEKSSYKECRDLVEQALSFKQGLYDPRNSYVYAAEYPFDISLSDKEWAKYSYESPDGIKEGYLSLKGTCDLVSIEDDCLVITDYKTGKSIKDWATDKEKDEKTLYKDPQLQLYYYALHKCFQQFSTIIINLYFIRLDKIFTIIFESKDIPKIEKYLSTTWKQMIVTDRPEFIDKSSRSWKCKMCAFSKNIQLGTNQTVCKYFQKELAVKGYQQTMLEYADWSILNKYMSGGSAKDRE